MEPLFLHKIFPLICNALSRKIFGSLRFCFGKGLTGMVDGVPGMTVPKMVRNFNNFWNFSLEKFNFPVIFPVFQNYFLEFFKNLSKAKGTKTFRAWYGNLCGHCRTPEGRGRGCGSKSIFEKHHFWVFRFEIFF